MPQTPSSDQSADVLKKRLATAEHDTQKLMQQLEEMGFSTKKDREKPIEHDNKIKKVTKDNKDSCMDTQSNLRTKTSKHVEPPVTLKKIDKNVIITEKNESKSAKHRPITPLSLKGLIPGVFSEEKTESNNYEHYLSKSTNYRSNETGNKMRQRAESIESKPSVGRHELEHELIRMKRVVSQLQQDLHFETESKQKAREDVEKMKSALEDISAAKAEVEMKVEELSSAKQKFSRRITEMKDELQRESSLRSSLEESHATLLSRLSDMEGLIANAQEEAKTNASGSNTLKAEIIKLKEDMETEESKRKRVEENYHILITEKDKLMINATSWQSETQRASQEMSRLQGQYADLIQQMEATKGIVDTLTANNKNLEESKTSLETKLKSITTDYEQLKHTQEETKESETRLAAEKTSLEEDFCKTREEHQKMSSELKEKKRKMEAVERELRVTKKSLEDKNEEFSSAADGLEVELSGLKAQLEAMEGEKQLVLRDKESLLEEVNQTVDTLMSERSRLQTELQASCVEAESLRTTCSRLEQSNAHLLERMGGLQHQQNAQRKVEETLNEMLEQKNRLAYENGKLQSSLSQVQHELATLTTDQGDITQLRCLSQSLQAKFTKSQQEMSELKVELQRLEGQAKSAVEDMERKDAQLIAALQRKEEAEKERNRVVGQLEMLEGRQSFRASNYEKNMEESKSVNKEIAATLEQVMASHSQLQVIVENLQIELGKRDAEISRFKNNRDKEYDEMKLNLKTGEEKLETIARELKKEKEKSAKKVAKEVSDMKKQTDNMSCRNQELVKINQELRQRLADNEKEKDDLRTKLGSQRHKLEYLHKAKKQLEEHLNKMKVVKEDIQELEQMRDEYMQKNSEQGETINSFVRQISSLQDEMRQLAAAHSNATQLLQLKEQALEKEKKIRQDMKRKLTESKRKDLEMSNRNRASSSDEKLQEVHSESLEISRHLQEAHQWFRGKFDKLQGELVASKQIQSRLERQNIDQRRSLENERSKAQDAAERAKEMIQTSRQTISKLADYAESADMETKQQIAHLRAGLNTPRTSRMTLRDLET